jgi:uncharacterized protein
MTPFDCPRCGAALSMTERQGIEIDYCPQCRGVWLDRGELDKIIERATNDAPIGSETSAPAAGWVRPTAAPPPEQSQPWTSRAKPRHDDDDDDRYRYRDHGGKRRKTWLSDLFD